MPLIQMILNNYTEGLGNKFADSEHDRSQSVGASEVGQCARKIFYYKNEGRRDFPDIIRDEGHIENWGARARGNTFEDTYWVRAMRQHFGKRLRNAGRAQQTLVEGSLSATPDGIITRLNKDEREALGLPDSATGYSNVCAVIDCKTVDPRTNLTEPKPEHVYQVQVQMGLVRRQTQYKPCIGILSYTDASFWNETKEFVIEFDDATFKHAVARANKIMAATSVDGDIKPEGWIAGGDECRYCPYTRICGVARRNVPYTEESESEKVDSQFASEIRDLALELKQAEADRDWHDQMARAAQNMIKDRLRERSVRRIPGVVTWSVVKGRTSYDNKAVQQAALAAGVDIQQFTITGEPTDRLTVLVTPALAPPAADK